MENSIFTLNRYNWLTFFDMALRFLIIIITCIFLSCNNDEQERRAQVFRYNQVGGITSLDPAFAKNQANIWAVNQLYNTLIQFDDSLNFLPSIAKSWNVSDDGLTYTFNLRGDVYFHDCDCFTNGKGRKVVAQDFVYSFNRLIDPAVASTGSWIFSGKLDANQPFSAPDDSTFVLKLKEPFRPMLGIMTMQYTSVVPKEAVEYFDKEFRRNAVGTGPFRQQRWTENEVLILEKNPDYWEMVEGERLPYLEEVVVSFIDNKGTEFLQFLNGDLDFVSDIDPGLKDRVLTLEGNLHQRFQDEIDLVRSPYLNTEYFGFIVNPEGGKNSIVTDKLLRQAVNYGFDREKMIRFMRNNKGIPATEGFIPAGLPAYDPDAEYGYSYNPEKARQLLKEAGYPKNGLDPVVILHAPSTFMDIAEYMQHQLKQVGINLEISVTQGGILRNMMEKGEVEFFRGSWIADYPDAESYLAMYYSKYGVPPRYTRFTDPYFDHLYEQAVKENDDEKRYELYRKMDSLIMESSAIVPLYYDEVYRFKQKNVEGLGVNPMNLLVLKNVKLN